MQRSLVAARELSEREGIEAEIIDLRSLSPYDWDAIAVSVKRTSKALVVYEDPYPGDSARRSPPVSSTSSSSGSTVR